MAGNSHAAAVSYDAQFGLRLPSSWTFMAVVTQNSMPINPGCALVGLGGECKSSRSDINIDGRPSTP
jgi:hypothetical protein